MVDKHELSDHGANAFFTAVEYAVKKTGTPSDRLTRSDFLRAAAIAEEAGDLKMVQRLLLLAEDEESSQRVSLGESTVVTMHGRSPMRR